MEWIINPVDKVYGEIITPPDKSITHRAIMLASIAEGESIIENYLSDEDCMSTLKAFKAMGVAIDRSPGRLIITGRGINGLKEPEKTIDAGNSGTTVRLLCGILAGKDFPVVINGDKSLSRRPMKRIMEPLRRMGCIFAARDDNFLPLTINGTTDLKPIDWKSDVASAQVKSAILLAGLQAKGVTSVTEPVKSRDHTERMLAAQGAHITEKGLKVSIEGPTKLEPLKIKIPGDISSAAFFMAAGLLIPDSKIVLYNVGINPTRDGIIEVLMRMNGRLSILKKYNVSGEPTADIVFESSHLKSIKIDSRLVPKLIDEIPIIALLATQAKGTTVITGAQELRVKESDRLRVIAGMLKRMGASVAETTDGLIITGPTKLRGITVDSCGDHRIAMTAAIAGLLAEGKTTVQKVECVNTSFSSFYSKLKTICKDCRANG